MKMYLTSIYWNGLNDTIPTSTHWMCQNCHMSYQLICSKEIWYGMVFRIVAVTFSIFFLSKKIQQQKKR